MPARAHFSTFHSPPYPRRLRPRVHSPQKIQHAFVVQRKAWRYHYRRMETPRFFGSKTTLRWGGWKGWWKDDRAGAKWNPAPRGNSEAREWCWNKWFMLLSSQVNRGALSAITLQISGSSRQPVWKQHCLFPEHFVLFCLQQQHCKRGSEIKK